MSSDQRDVRTNKKQTPSEDVPATNASSAAAGQTPPQETQPQDQAQDQGEDYAVGYGRPPKHSRFKPGQSGNRKGRPKGRKNQRTVYEDVMGELIPITQSGKTRKRSAMEVTLIQIRQAALNGDTRAQKMLLDHGLRVDAFETIEDAEPEPISQTGQLLLDQLITERAALTIRQGTEGSDATDRHHANDDEGTSQEGDNREAGT
jgi:hypothetical protein